MELPAGRDFNGADAATTGKVVIVNQTAAARLWPGRRYISLPISYP